jgi:hypothetical protein
MSNTISKNERLHPSTDEISKRFETWWNDEGRRIALDWGVKQAAQTAWHNGAYVAVSKCSSITDILLAEVTIEADKT